MYLSQIFKAYFQKNNGDWEKKNELWVGLYRDFNFLEKM